MTVTFLFKTELLQDDKKKQDEIRKNWRQRLKQDKNWCKCILMWWSTDETEINLSYIWVKFEWNEMRCILTWWCTAKLKYIWITSESNINEMSESNLDKIWVRSELSWDDEDWT